MAIDTGALYYLVDPFVQWENVNGKPIVGGHVEVFEAGTDNKIITYADWDGTRHPFKIPLGSDGRAVILVDPGYRYDAYVYDSFNNLVCSRLNIIPLSDGDITIDGMGQVYHDDTLSGKGTPNSPLTVISGGKVYGGIYPIDVNNELDMISADNVPLGVQAPLYFAQDDDEGLVIALSSVPVPEGTMNESAFGYEDGKITGYNGSGFSAGLNYEAGSYVDIDGNTINVTGLQPAGNYQSAGDYVVHDELSSYATQDWVENQSYMKEYMESAFYPSTSNPSGYLTAHQDISNKLDTTAFSTVSGDFLTAVPSEYITENTLQSGLSSKLDSTAFSTVSGNFLTAHQSLDGLMSANLLEISDNKITGYNGTAFAGQGGGVTGDFELSAGSGISIEDFPLEQKTVISVTAQGGNPEVEQAVIDNSATWDSVTSKADVTAIPSTAGLATEDWVTAQGYITNDAITGKQDITGMTAYQEAGNYLSANALDELSGNWENVTAKQDALVFGYHDTAISSIDESALYDNSAHARINTLAGRISDLSSNKLDTTAFSDVSGTFLTAHQDLSDYQTTAGMTAYQPIGDYVQGSDLSLNSYDKISAISGHEIAGEELPEGVMVESGLEYDNTEISGYSGSAFKDVALTDVVTANSGAWGGSALPISAGPGIKFEMVDNTLVASTDETVLWSGYSTGSAPGFDLSDDISSFSYIEFYAVDDDGWCGYSRVESDYCTTANRITTTIGHYGLGDKNFGTRGIYVHPTSNTHLDSKSFGFDYVDNCVENNKTHMTKIVGINRK